MKREVQTYPKVKKIFPRIFWKQCMFCKREFKKELGYKIEYEYSTSFSYCCNECAIDEDDLKKYFKKERLQWKKPKRNEW